MTPRVCVIGASGMAGSTIATYLREGGHTVETLASTRKLDENTVLLDVTDQAKFSTYLDSRSFNVIINCVGVLLGKANDHPERTVYLNSYLPRLLESKYAKSNTKVIHLSTDCVFSGQNGPYREDSSHDGQLFYDRTKSLGEIDNNKDLTFRMSIIGPEIKAEGEGLFNWFMNQESPIYGYEDAFWAGVTSLELAKGIEAAMEENLTGLYHLVPTSRISKLGLLTLFKEVFGKEIEIKTKSNPSNKQLMNTRVDFRYEVSGYRRMVEEMKRWVYDHPDLYEGIY